MDTLLRKYFWVLELTLVAVSAFFVASTANAVLGANLRPIPEIPKNEGPVVNAHAKEDTVVSMDDVRKANIFKTPRQEPVKMLDISKDVVEPNPEDLEPILSALKGTLVGTIVADNPQWSLCVIVETGTNTTGVYGVGSMVQDEYTVTKIERKKVTLMHGSRLEYLNLEAEAPRLVPAVTKKAEEAPADGVRELAPGKYVVAQNEIDSTLTNLNQVAMQARIVPNFEGGKANGFKLFSIKPGSIYSKIGLQNGDVVQKINGFEMNSPDKALEIYGKLKDSKHVTIDVNRNGKAMNMDYTIR